ncbi:MAG TPA: DUF2934 domain-containing protein [Vicinamibacterales bacterium]|nr:DUF2934 domain-containing protein [Vicinamibacterales bacterium]
MAKHTTSSLPPTSTPTQKRTTRKKKSDGASDASVIAGTATAADGRPSEDDIRLRAYHRYLERGGGHGADFDDWLEAERDLKSPRHN